MTKRQAIRYLTYYYGGPRKPTDRELKRLVRRFQKEHGALKVDGVIGPKTSRAMLTPRCGCTPAHMEQMRRKMESKWNKKRLSYFIDRYVDEIPRDDQVEIFDVAWRSWTNVCDLSVSKVNKPELADMVISVGRGRRHGFDGPGRTLAWAFLPRGDGNQLWMRFDLDETWIDDPVKQGILLLNVSVHEFGHLIGLGHSEVDGAIMAPFYNPDVARPQENDDVIEAQNRYGEPSLPEPPAPDGEFKLTVNGTLSIDGYKLVPAGNN